MKIAAYRRLKNGKMDKKSAIIGMVALLFVLFCGILAAKELAQATTFQGVFASNKEDKAKAEAAKRKAERAAIEAANKAKRAAQEEANRYVNKVKADDEQKAKAECARRPKTTCSNTKNAETGADEHYISTRVWGYDTNRGCYAVSTNISGNSVGACQ